MLGQNQKDVLAPDFNALHNSRDLAEIEALSETQEQVYAEFRRRAEEHEIYPEPVPHCHTAHEEIARISRWTSAFANVAGLFVAVLLTVSASVSKFWGVVGAVIFFLAVEFVVDLGVFAIPRRTFINRFRHLIVGPLALLVSALTLLLIERFATAELAQTLLRLDAYAWWGLEIALLFLASIATAAATRFGWSGALKDRYDSCANRIALLRLQIDRRSQSLRTTGKALALLLLMVLCSTLGSTALAADCPTVMIDRTGSVADPHLAESHLVETLLRHTDKLPCLSVVLFSAHPFTDPGVLLSSTPVPDHAVFEPIRLANRANATNQMRQQFEGILAKEFAPARCTSVPEILERAVIEDKPVLLLTDGLDDCRTTKPSLISRTRAITVVLARSKTDGTEESQIFRARKELVQQITPNSSVFPVVQMEAAVDALLRSQAVTRPLYTDQ